MTLVFIAVVWQYGDTEYANGITAVMCSGLVVLLTAVVYIIMDYYDKNIMPAERYVFVMAISGLVTFLVLYASLEYFYS